eukprot:GHVN01063369.1.p1 GENE.GHVN01063369.1~~GHVN01063369.1.p1  ORF type:complete len:312 (+),score=9.35 GHVN01063369.1:52-987(+)
MEPQHSQINGGSCEACGSNAHTAYYSELTSLAHNARRFGTEPDAETTATQLQDRHRVMKETGSLTEFCPIDERAFEDWVDVNARKIKAWGVCIPLFKEIWCAAGGEAFSQVIAMSGLLIPDTGPRRQPQGDHEGCPHPRSRAPTQGRGAWGGSCGRSSRSTSRTTAQPPRSPTTPCYGCGEMGHWRKDCPFGQHRCHNCHKLGHIAKACRNMAIKDTQGRVSQSLRAAPSKVTFETRVDRTTQDKVTTAADVLQQIRLLAQAKTQKATQRRQEKRPAGKPTKRAPRDHPLGAGVQEDDDEEAEALQKISIQ